MRSVQVISTTELEPSQPELQRRTDPPPVEDARDELRASRGVFMAVGLGVALWALVILAIRLILH